MGETLFLSPYAGFLCVIASLLGKVAASEWITINVYRLCGSHHIALTEDLCVTSPKHLIRWYIS